MPSILIGYKLFHFWEKSFDGSKFFCPTKPSNSAKEDTADMPIAACAANRGNPQQNNS
jgi:hypothetical protein